MCQWRSEQVPRRPPTPPQHDARACRSAAQARLPVPPLRARRRLSPLTPKTDVLVSMLLEVVRADAHHTAFEGITVHTWAAGGWRGVEAQLTHADLCGGAALPDGVCIAVYTANAMHLLSRPQLPLFSRAPPGVRSLHPHKCHVKQCIWYTVPALSRSQSRAIT